MEYFLQQLINGLTLGSIYGLIAIGYTMVYGIIGMINFAHGDIFMVGAFMALIVFLLLSSIFVGMPAAVALVVMMIVGTGADQPVELDDRAGRLQAACAALSASHR
jgi:branched-chain amino acid transport system permease protein